MVIIVDNNTIIAPISTNTFNIGSVTEHFTKFLIDLQFHIRLHKIIICFDLDMDFLLDNNMVTAIVMINELIHLVKLYHATVIYCEQNV